MEQGQISDAIVKRTKAAIEGIEDARSVHSTTFYIGLLVEPKPSTLTIPLSNVSELHSDASRFSSFKWVPLVQGN